MSSLTNSLLEQNRFNKFNKGNRLLLEMLNIKEDKDATSSNIN